jgi:hypothetical protein
MRKLFEFIEEKIDSECNDWSTICEDCVNKHSIDRKHLDEAGHMYGQCGIKGCQNDSDFYIDFP